MAVLEQSTEVNVAPDVAYAIWMRVEDFPRFMEGVTQVRRVNDLISEISAASVEQSSGISQVGDAVNQLDQVTQQNAALVEESAAAAESLKHQAANLAQIVAVFKLPKG